MILPVSSSTVWRGPADGFRTAVQTPVLHLAHGRRHSTFVPTTGGLRTRHVEQGKPGRLPSTPMSWPPVTVEGITTRLLVFADRSYDLSVNAF